MNNFTREDLSHSQPATNPSDTPGKECQQFHGELPVSKEEWHYLQPSLAMLEEWKLSPRQATIDAIMQYARQKEEAIH